MQEIYQHFRPDEYPFIDQVMEWREQVLAQYSFKLTDFLDPREQDIINSIIGDSDDILFSFWGGQENAERKRALLYPSYYTPTKKDYDLTIFEIKYPVKFLTIEHPQILGTLMSLGLKRQKFGDILMQDERIQVIVASEIAQYVQMNVQSIGKAKVELEKVSSKLLIEMEHEWEEKAGTVSSLRLDAVLAETYKISRQKVISFIRSGQAKVNWRVIENPAYECKVHDHLSLRGFGRSKLISLEGKTKKEKWRILIGIQK